MLNRFKELKVSDPNGRLRKVNVCDVHKILPSDQIVSSIPDEQVLGRRSKYINALCILKVVAIIDAFSHEHFPHVRINHLLPFIYTYIYILFEYLSIMTRWVLKCQSTQVLSLRIIIKLK